MLRHGAPDQVVGTSKTFRQLPGSRGRPRPATARTSRVSCGTPTWRPLAERLPKLTQAEWTKLPGVLGQTGYLSCRPAPSSPDAILDLLDVDQLELCPGPCVRASSCGAWICSRRGWRITGSGVDRLTCRYPGPDPTAFACVIAVDDRGAGRALSGLLLCVCR